MLLDTHALLWLLNDDLRLPMHTKQKIEETELVFVSIVSIWEIAIKVNIGKLSLLTPFETIQTNLYSLNIQEIPILFEDSITYINLPLFGEHKDPFDRMIIAQAVSRSILIVSADKKFDLYPVQRIWE
jgi:PIN domain nuclease of toxin-antitoxin system